MRGGINQDSSAGGAWRGKLRWRGLYCVHGGGVGSDVGAVLGVVSSTGRQGGGSDVSRGGGALICMLVPHRFV